MSMSITTDECGEIVARLDCTTDQAHAAYLTIVAEGCAWHNAHPGYVHPGAPVNFDHECGAEYGYAYFLPDEGPALGVSWIADTQPVLEVRLTPSREGDDRLDGTTAVLDMSTDDFFAMRDAFRRLLGTTNATT